MKSHKINPVEIIEKKRNSQTYQHIGGSYHFNFKESPMTKGQMILLFLLICYIKKASSTLVAESEDTSLAQLTDSLLHSSEKCATDLMQELRYALAFIEKATCPINTKQKVKVIAPKTPEKKIIETPIKDQEIIESRLVEKFAAGQYKIVKRMIKNSYGEITINSTFFYEGKKMTLLQYAICNNDLNGVRFLLNENCDPFAVGYFKKNAFQLAIEVRNHKILKLLLDFNLVDTKEIINLTFNYEEEYLTLLELAIKINNTQAIVTLLMPEYEMDTTYIIEPLAKMLIDMDNDSITTHLIESLYSRLDMLKIIAKMREQNADEQKINAIFVPLMQNFYSISEEKRTNVMNDIYVDYVVENKRNFELLTSNLKFTPELREHMQRMILSAIEKQFSEAIIADNFESIFEKVRLETTLLDINRPFRYGRYNKFTFLGLAVFHDRQESVQFMLSQGALIDINKQNIYSAIEVAINQGRSAILRDLLEFDPEQSKKLLNKIYTRNKKQFILLEEALIKKNTVIIETMLQFGADPNLKSDNLSLLTQAFLIDAVNEEDSSLDHLEISPLILNYQANLNEALIELNNKSIYSTTLPMCHDYKITTPTFDKMKAFLNARGYELLKKKSLLDYVFSAYSLLIVLFFASIYFIKGKFLGANVDKMIEEKIIKTGTKRIHSESDTKIMLTEHDEINNALRIAEAKAETKLVELDKLRNRIAEFLSFYSPSLSQVEVDKQFPRSELTNVIHRAFSKYQSCFNYYSEKLHGLSLKINAIKNKPTSLYPDHVEDMKELTITLNVFFAELQDKLPEKRKSFDIAKHKVMLKLKSDLIIKSNPEATIKNEDEHSLTTYKLSADTPATKKLSVSEFGPEPLSDKTFYKIGFFSSEDKSLPTFSSNTNELICILKNCSHATNPIVHYLIKILEAKNAYDYSSINEPVFSVTRVWIIRLLAVCYENKKLYNNNIRHFMSHLGLLKPTDTCDNNRIYLRMSEAIEELVRRFIAPDNIEETQILRIATYLDVTLTGVLKSEGLYNDKEPSKRKDLWLEKSEIVIPTIKRAVNMLRQLINTPHVLNTLNNYREYTLDHSNPHPEIIKFMDTLALLGEQALLVTHSLKESGTFNTTFSAIFPGLNRLLVFKNSLCHEKAVDCEVTQFHLVFNHNLTTDDINRNLDYLTSWIELTQREFYSVSQLTLSPEYFFSLVESKKGGLKIKLEENDISTQMTP